MAKATLRLPSRDKLLRLFHYDPDTGVVTRKTSTGGNKAGSIVGRSASNKHLKVQIDSVTYLLHRVIWKMQFDEEPGEIDHENLIRNDNRLINLRSGDDGINQRNSPLAKNNTTGFKGVTYNKHAKRFKATICVRGKNIFLGYYDTPEEAHEVYKQAKRKHHGMEAVNDRSNYS